VRGNLIEFHYLPEKDNEILNYENGGTLIALGASIKNAELEALSLGYVPNVNYIENGSCVAKMELKEGAEIDDDSRFLHEAITKRHTNRKAYRKIPLDEKQRNAILEVFNSNGYGVGSVLIESRESMQNIARALTTMEEIALGNQSLHRLFFKDILWSKDKNDSGINGMYIKTLELPPPAQVLFRFLRHWGFAKKMAKIGFPKLVAKTNAQQNAAASAFGIVTSKHTNRATYIQIGKFVEHVWLLASAYDLSFQIVTGITFLARSMQDENTEKIFTADEKGIVLRAFNKIKSYVGKEETPILIFVSGKAILRLT